MSKRNNLELIKKLEESGDYRILQRVSERLSSTIDTEKNKDLVAIIDLETTGLKAEEDEIIELGLLLLAYTEDGRFALRYKVNQLQQPSKPISAELTQLTGITNEQVAGQSINWQEIAEKLSDCSLVICHNAAFDRKFLELQTPNFVARRIAEMNFACSARDINWRQLGYESNKLEYLNFKMGYFYEGHRALVDCWATLNLFLAQPACFQALLTAVTRCEYLLCAVNAAFEKKDLLKQRGYRWSNGLGALPKAWWTLVAAEDYEQELLYLHECIYNGRKIDVPVNKLTAKERYSPRAESVF